MTTGRSADLTTKKMLATSYNTTYFVTNDKVFHTKQASLQLLVDSLEMVLPCYPKSRTNLTRDGAPASCDLGLKSFHHWHAQAVRSDRTDRPRKQQEGRARTRSGRTHAWLRARPEAAAELCSCDARRVVFIHLSWADMSVREAPCQQPKPSPLIPRHRSFHRRLKNPPPLFSLYH